MNKFALAAAIFAISTSAQAYDEGTVVLGIGYTEPFDTKHAVIGGVEYRSASYAPEQFFGVGNVSWIAGAEYDNDDSGYAYAGLLYDWAVTDSISIVPSVAAGLYKQGDGKDLGGAFEFRDTIEVNYKLTENERIGLMLSHKSNASIFDHNPGTEIVQVNYSMGLK
jgi:hypothetical protein